MKLKKLINENLWNERKFGEPLPTLADTTRAYKLKQEDLNENDLSKVMMKQQISSLGFQLTLNVRNKVLSSYKDIMNMPV